MKIQQSLIILISNLRIHIAYPNLFPDLCQGVTNYFSVENLNNLASEEEMHTTRFRRTDKQLMNAQN